MQQGMGSRMRAPGAAGPGGMGAEGGMDGNADNGRPAASQQGAVEVTDYDAIVELSGVVYLYNPPDITKLGGGGAANPDKRSFGVPKTAPRVPGTTASGGGMMMMGGGGGHMPAAAPKP